MVDKLPTDLEGMEASMERLLALIDDVYKYVDNVVVRRCNLYSKICGGLGLKPHFFFSQEGHIEPDNNIGRFISDTIASLPKLSPVAFDKLANDSLQVIH